jgi:aminomethyltransferase
MTDSTPAAPLRRTPLYDAHLRAGAKMVPFAGWVMPVQYAGVIEEHRAVRTAAGLFDVSHMGEFRLTGAGAEAFLQRLTPNDVSQLRPGRAHYSALLNERGTYLDDILVYRFAELDYQLVVNASNIATDFAWVAAQPHPAADLRNVSDDNALLALQGPRAQAILARLTDADLNSIRYYRFAEARVDGRPAIVSRTGYTGEDGFEVFLAPADGEAVWEALLEAGAREGLRPAGLGARDTLRLEAGMPLYGHEIDDTTTPFDAGLEWVVKLDKGDFIGRRALIEAAAAVPVKRLVGFEVSGRGIARQGSAVVVGSEAVGIVTSGTWSPTFEKALGMAYVPANLSVVGTSLALDVRGKLVEARVVALPFYKRSRS